jgi:hypothetical protein
MLSHPLIFEKQQVGGLPTASLVTLVSTLARNLPQSIFLLVMPPHAPTKKPIGAVTTQA